MQLVLVYDRKVQFDYSHEVIIPIEYKSEELLLSDFEKELNLAIANKEYSFKFLYIDFQVEDFYSGRMETHDLPDIIPLNDWFNEYYRCKI